MTQHGDTRADGRSVSELRPVSLTPGFQTNPAGSCLVTFGGTRVVCSASVETKAPRWRGERGWITAEYAMLPGAPSTRSNRERNGAGGRSKEIERLIGRSLRMAVDVDRLPELTITVDCDVLDADGGTRTASITGGWVALVLALREHGHGDLVDRQIAAVSVGVVDGRAVLDLPYEEDSRADVDCNVVMTSDGDTSRSSLIEVQGTGEAAPFDRASLDTMLDLAEAGCTELFELQRQALA